MKINCDIGERGSEHPVDRALMEYIDIANIACGGHAGDENSIKAFRMLAEKFGVDISAHLSYPDRENFGRRTMDLEKESLLKSLDDQYLLMNDVKIVKFHGALYNDCAGNRQLASLLAGWLEKQGITRVITQYDSELALACESLGMNVIAEAFAERRYAVNPETGKLALVSRTKEYASIHSLKEALDHSLEIFTRQKVSAYRESASGIMREEAPLKAETICIHSDSEIALDLAAALKEVLKDNGDIRV